MNLNERIERTKPYFLQFNVIAEEDAIYVVARFPQNWTIPDRAALKNTYKVETAPMNNGICFATETKNGEECVFDALDYVINFNKCVAERKELLIAKVNELKNLFATEDLEKLKTLTFAFDKPKKKINKKTTQFVEHVGTDQAVLEEQDSADQCSVNDNAQTENNEVEEDSSLMALAKNLVED